MTNPVVESVFKFKVGTYTIRVWREHNSTAEAWQASQLYGVNNDDIISLAETLIRAYEPPPVILEAIGKMPRVNAVEITSIYESGVVFYQDWK